jgi:hypothetical protein
MSRPSLNRIVRGLVCVLLAALTVCVVGWGPERQSVLQGAPARPERALGNLERPIPCRSVETGGHCRTLRPYPYRSPEERRQQRRRWVNLVPEAMFLA